MKEGWEILDFEKCLVKVPSTTKIPKKRFLGEGAFPIVSQEEDYINGYWDNEDDVFKVEKPVVLFGDHTKIVKLIDFDFVKGADGIKVFLPKEDINSKFFAYQLQSLELKDLGYARHYRLLKKKKISIPPLPEQKQIVAILDKAFAAIDQAQANIEKNIENAKELFQSKLNDIFSQKGEGWEEKTLGEVCEFYNGKAHEKDIDEDGEYVVVNSKFISSDGNVMKYTKNQIFPLFENDIVMVMSDVPNGKALAKCYIIDENEKYSLNQRICAIRSRNYFTKYLFYNLNRHKFLLSFNNGENQTNLRKGDILKCPLFLPSIDKQIETANYIDELIEYTETIESHYQQKLANLEELKKSILQKAFSGELTQKPVAV